MGDEGLERFSYYSIKDEFLDQPIKQVVANTVTNPTLSETVALLIESWSRMTPRQKAWMSTLLRRKYNPSTDWPRTKKKLLQSAQDAQKVEVPEEATIKKVAEEVSLLIKNIFQPASGGFGVASGWVVS
jgi:hypothetical protein